ncbi:Rossmann-like domain-containing protein, partial [Elusimicrobiota bacterium]
TFSTDGVRLTDRDADNIGVIRFGVKIEDGDAVYEDLIRWADVVVITGTTLLNGTFDSLAACARKHGKDYLVYGMTVAGVSALIGLPRVCFFGRNE